MVHLRLTDRRRASLRIRCRRDGVTCAGDSPKVVRAADHHRSQVAPTAEVHRRPASRCGPRRAGRAASNRRRSTADNRRLRRGRCRRCTRPAPRGVSRAARLRPSISNETVENKVIRGAKLGARFRESRLKTSAKGLNFHKVEIALEKERTQVEDVRLDATLEGRRQHQVAAVGRPAALDQRRVVHPAVDVGVGRHFDGALATVRLPQGNLRNKSSKIVSIFLLFVSSTVSSTWKKRVGLATKSKLRHLVEITKSFLVGQSFWKTGIDNYVELIDSD